MKKKSVKQTKKPVSRRVQKFKPLVSKVSAGKSQKNSGSRSGLKNIISRAIPEVGDTTLQPAHKTNPSGLDIVFGMFKGQHKERGIYGVLDSLEDSLDEVSSNLGQKIHSGEILPEDFTKIEAETGVVSSRLAEIISSCTSNPIMKSAMGAAVNLIKKSSIYGNLELIYGTQGAAMLATNKEVIEAVSLILEKHRKMNFLDVKIIKPETKGSKHKKNESQKR